MEKIRKRTKEMMKRALALVLALCLSAAAFTAMYTDYSYAGERIRFSSRNIWKGGEELIYGQPRNYLFKWKASNGKDTFCIQPGKHMGKDVKALVGEYKIGDKNIPYIDSREEFAHLALLGKWYESKGKKSDTAYAAVQVLIWALLEGDLDGAVQEAEKVDAHVAGNVRLAVEEALQYLHSFPEQLPRGIYRSKEEALAHPLRMDDEEEVRIDLSAYPKLAALHWTGLQGEGFVAHVEEEQLIIRYRGKENRPKGVLVCRQLPADLQGILQGSESLQIYIPDKVQKDQIMISASSESDNGLYIAIGGAKPRKGNAEVEVYRHRERFRADYNVEVHKKDARTGQDLEGSVFAVLAAFDAAQLKGGRLQAERLFPQPALWEGYRKMGEIRTDAQGRGRFKALHFYEYDKVYAGHPEPEYLEVPELVTDEQGGDNSEEIAAIEEENERLQREWEALVERCEAETDFHHDDIEVARQMMLEDRDESYRQFIRLLYRYTLREQQAREGYVLHGLHNDDLPVETVVSNAAQAGAERFLSEERIEGFGEEESLWENRLLSYGDDEEEESFLPDPEMDEEPPLAAGDTERLSYTFTVEDHSTEGEIHISKRDRDLYLADEAASYGKSQGDAKLAGAVYGLYAASDIVHPDGKSGIVYKKGDLTAVAASDEKGDASFLAYTEESEHARNKEGTWIGHPLLMGSYYIRELLRSEGYELSVEGRLRKESNREAVGEEIHLRAGSVEVSAPYHRIDAYDGSFHDVDVSYFKTEEGYQLLFQGYPAGSRIYELSYAEGEREENRLVSSYMATKSDAFGNPVYRLAEGGELKRDAEGKPVILEEEDSNAPLSESLVLRHRLSLYPKTENLVSDIWEEKEVEAESLKEALNTVLREAAYTIAKAEDACAWEVLDLQAENEKELAEQILDWYEQNSFFNVGAVASIEESGRGYRVCLYYDYRQRGLTADALYDARSGRIYVKKPFRVQGQEKESHIWLPYEQGEYAIEGLSAKVFPKKKISGSPAFGESIKDYMKAEYHPKYAEYEAGEVLLGAAGEKLVEKEWREVYEKHTVKEEQEVLKPLEAVFDAETMSYTVSIDNDTDWTQVQEKQKKSYRIVTPVKTIEEEGREWAYTDYLLHRQGVGVAGHPKGREEENGSYMVYVDLLYPGQQQVIQDAGTKAKPLVVLQRVIRQSIRVSKDIAKFSYEGHNTYRVPEDDFHRYYGGYGGRYKKFIPGFCFRLYLLSDLEERGLLSKKEDGNYDYEALFRDVGKKDLLKELSLDWDLAPYDKDDDPKTLHADRGNGMEPYYGVSKPLPYGRYLVREEVPEGLLTKHYETDGMQEISLPFVPRALPDGSVDESVPSESFVYGEDRDVEDMEESFGIRLNEENPPVRGHGHRGDFTVYRYGKTPKVQRGVYEAALVPWSVLEPRYGEVINDAGDVGNRETAFDEGVFNYIGFAKVHFENSLYSSKLRIEKTDAQTGENILHEGALFKIYAAKRDVQGGPDLQGSGRVLFTEKDVKGSRQELEARGDVSDIRWDKEEQCFKGKVRAPLYDEKEQVIMHNEKGEEVGIFRVLSTEIPVVSKEGKPEKKKTGYIETFQPLSAGVYVLVEVAAPEGYQKSAPIAVEIYKNGVHYYEDGIQNKRREAERFQYGGILPGVKDRAFGDVARVPVPNTASSLRIHKVEDGDACIGDENGLDGLQNVNDKGDGISYIVRGRKEELEARGDVLDIRWDSTKGEYYGRVEKHYQGRSESLLAVSEEEALEKENDKPLYDKTSGAYSGYAIGFDVYVKDALLCLYEGVLLEEVQKGIYRGLEICMEKGKICGVRILGSALPKKWRAGKVGVEAKAPYRAFYDAEEEETEAVELFCYDLEKVRPVQEEDSGDWQVLNENGNPLSYVDPETGMAYAKDEYGRKIAYKMKAGEKVVATVPRIHKEEGKEKIYQNVSMEKDEQGLPLYYRDFVLEKEKVEFSSTMEPRIFKRLPFGAYILEEKEAPWREGYLPTPAQGFILQESSRTQDMYMQNAFTKIHIAKLDVNSRQTVPDAVLRLYTSKKTEDGSGAEYPPKKDMLYREWVSGYVYEDGGEQKTENGKALTGTQGYWIDHIPVGTYILEEYKAPLDRGYVGAKDMVLEVKESADVQTFVMENDYTALEIKKYDAKSGECVSAVLGLYRASLDAEGKPVMQDVQKDGEIHSLPLYEEEHKLLSWRTQNGADLREEGRLVHNEYGESYVRYPYRKHRVEGTKNAVYYITEKGHTRFDYLPPGYYVLTEEEAPVGYATALPQLIYLEEKGQKELLQFAEMPDKALELEIYKLGKDRKKVVKDAYMEIYALDEKGEKRATPSYAFYTGADGRFSREDAEKGEIPEGFAPGDLKPHRISYIPKGNYVLREVKTPYGFLKAEDVVFQVEDSLLPQKIYMEDEIPKAKLHFVKRDKDRQEKVLPQARFVYCNLTLGQDLEEIISDERGRGESRQEQPIGYLGDDGYFHSYTYGLKELEAPSGYMRAEQPFEWVYAYRDEYSRLLSFSCELYNDMHQLRIQKKEAGSGENLAGARLQLWDGGKKKLLAEWESTKEAHYINGLEAGNYILHEVQTPSAGYRKAEDIYFSIKENADTLVEIEMPDEHTRIEICKTEGRSGELLAGARLALKDGQGRVLYEWISEKSAKRINGLAPGRYILEELEAPLFYQKAGPKEIIVEDSIRPQKIYYANYLLEQGGEASPKEYISFYKKDEEGNALAGAEFSFYREDGGFLTKAVSDTEGKIRIEKPAAGTYYFVESKAPAAYYRSAKKHRLYVRADGKVEADFSLINKRIREIVLYKKDLDTGQPLEGAEFSVFTETGELLTKLRSDPEGRLRFAAPYIGKYYIQENKAPSGYADSSALYEIELNEEGEMQGESFIYNSREKIGRIVFVYDKGVLLIPETGDKENRDRYICSAILSLICASFLLWQKKKKMLMKGLLGICMLILSFSLIRQEAYARSLQEEAFVEYSTEALPVIRIPMQTAYGDWPGTSEAEIQTVRQNILFKEAEGDFAPPEELSLRIIREFSDREEESTVSFFRQSQYEKNRRFTDDFRVKMTVYDYDAKEYAFRDRRMAKESVLEELKTMEAEILDFLKLPQSHYKINEIKWQGEPYEQNGSICRNALVYGEREKKDLYVCYEARLLLPKAAEEEGENKEDAPLSVQEAKTVKTEAKDFWQAMFDFVGGPLSVGLLFLLLFPVCFLWHWGRYRKKEN